VVIISSGCYTDLTGAEYIFSPILVLSSLQTCFFLSVGLVLLKVCFHVSTCLSEMNKTVSLLATLTF